VNTIFHSDNAAVFNSDALRAAARDEVINSSLIFRAREGDRAAAVALHRGFWPFVFEFEHAIDRHPLPRKPLVERFGIPSVREVFRGLFEAVREMKEEEGSHALHWKKDAECLGIDALEAPTVAGVTELISDSYTTDHPQFFAVLAGTEYIAEELGRHLVHAKPYTSLFSRKRWMWGEVHIEARHLGPSHLEIDLDLARAYGGERSIERITQMVFNTIRLFGRAARDVEEALAAAAD
jgi:hypothetical protein